MRCSKVSKKTGWSIALIKLQPAATPQLFGGVPVMLVTHKSRPRSGAEASDLQDVEDTDHRSPNPRRVIFVLPNAVLSRAYFASV